MLQKRRRKSLSAQVSWTLYDTRGLGSLTCTKAQVFALAQSNAFFIPPPQKKGLESRRSTVKEWFPNSFFSLI